MKPLQQLLLDAIKEQLPSHQPLEVALAQVLGHDDLALAYAWVRNQSSLSLNDAQLLADHFGLSLGHLADAQPSVVPFRFRAIGYNIATLHDYFTAILEELQRTDVLGLRRLTIGTNDFPIFTLFQFPELAAFKLYFWGRTVYDLPAFAKRRFDLDEIDTAHLRLGEQAWRQYLKMPSLEIWSSDIVNNSLKQVYHAWRFGLFAKRSDALNVLDKMDELLQHIALQAELGRKFHPKNYPPKNENFQLFYNEAAISANTLLFSSEEVNVAFLVHNTLNYLVTEHPTFCLQMDIWLKNLQQKSLPISLQNDDLRKNFFEQLRQNVDYVRVQIQ
jgi:hypothetical protein